MATVRAVVSRSSLLSYHVATDELFLAPSLEKADLYATSILFADLHSAHKDTPLSPEQQAHALAAVKTVLEHEHCKDEALKAKMNKAKSFFEKFDQPSAGTDVRITIEHCIRLLTHITGSLPRSFGSCRSSRRGSYLDFYSQEQHRPRPQKDPCGQAS